MYRRRFLLDRYSFVAISTHTTKQNSAHGLHLLTLAARTAANHQHPHPHQRGAAAPASFQALCQAALPRWAFLVDLAIAIKVRHVH